MNLFLCWQSIINSKVTASLVTASVFNGSWINILWTYGSHGFAIPRFYDTYRKFLLLYWTYLSVCVYLFCICDILQLTSTFPRHGLNQYSLQHFSHRSSSSWSTSASPPLQYENLYWRPKSIMPTQQTIQLVIPELQSCVARPLFLCRAVISFPAQI